MGPLLFEPYIRPQIWGGRRLETHFGRKLPTEGTFGESWEISAHPTHTTIVRNGPLAGQPLDRLWRESRTELLGQSKCDLERFPLLIKILDCQELLSIQVHPDDAKAARLLGNESGKTESWIVLDADPEAVVYAGLCPGVDASTLQQHLDAGTLEQTLHRVQPKPGDCFFIEAGTVHAMGGGLVIAEVQQTSDATFRLYDWNRVGPDGQPRQLHVRESLESIDWSRGPVDPIVGKREPTPGGNDVELLIACPFFEARRYAWSQAESNPLAGRLSIWMVASGNLRLEGLPETLGPGGTILIPGSCPSIPFEGTGTLLAYSLP